MPCNALAVTQSHMRVIQPLVALCCGQLQFPLFLLLASGRATIARLTAHGYIAPMRRSPLFRLASFLLAMVVGFSTPGLALAHGYAHHEAHEHSQQGRQHQHGDREDPTAAPHAELTPSAKAAGNSGDHDHPQLSLALSTRADVPLFVMPAGLILPAYIVIESQTSLLLTAAPPRAGPPDAPPRQPRAPPLS